MIGFYAAVAVLLIRVRRANLAATALVLVGLLVVALVLEATAWEQVGGYAALGLVLAFVMVGLAFRLGAWTSSADDPDLE